MGALWMPESSLLDSLSPAAELLGRRVIEVDSKSGVVRLEYDAKPEFTNRHGTVAGGFLAAMLDSATSVPVLLALPEDATAVTTNLEVSFERPARVGRLSAVSRVLTQNDREVYSTSELLDSEENVVASATATFRILKR